MPPLTTTERVLMATIERIGGGIVLPELAYQTGMDPIDVMAHMESLLRRREAYPWSYCTPTSAGKLLALAQASPSTCSARGSLVEGPLASHGRVLRGPDESITLDGPQAAVEGRRL